MHVVAVGEGLLCVMLYAQLFRHLDYNISSALTIMSKFMKSPHQRY